MAKKKPTPSQPGRDIHVLWHDPDRQTMFLIGPFVNKAAADCHVGGVTFAADVTPELVAITLTRQLALDWAAEDYAGVPIEERGPLNGEETPAPLRRTLPGPRKVSKGLILTLVGEGNPDMQQYSRIAPLRNVPVQDLRDASKLCLAYIEAENLGAGNWGGSAGHVVKDGKAYAYVSYNGRIWLPVGSNAKKWEPHPDAPEDLRGKEL